MSSIDQWHGLEGHVSLAHLQDVMSSMNGSVWIWHSVCIECIAKVWLVMYVCIVHCIPICTYMFASMTYTLHYRVDNGYSHGLLLV